MTYQISSQFLREDNVTLRAEILLPESPLIHNGYFLNIIFNNLNDVLRFVEPVCNLVLRGNSFRNYLSYCIVDGPRIKMSVMGDLPTGNVFILTVSNLLNPTWITGLWSTGTFEVQDPNLRILSRSSPTSLNFNPPNFTYSDQLTYLSFYREEEPETVGDPPVSVPVEKVKSFVNMLS